MKLPYKLPLADMSERYRRLYSASIYDILDEKGYSDQTLSLNIKPLTTDMVVSGPAFTLMGTRNPIEEKDEMVREDFRRFEEIYEHSVVVIDGEGDDQVGHWGELLSTAAQARGAAGVVIDGGTRDSSLLLKMQKWPVFCRYTTPIESKGRWRLVAHQTKISLSGTLSRYVNVRPGDWIFGDMDAVIVIPMEIAEDVLIAAEAVRETENQVRAEFRNGGSYDDIWEKYGRL